MEYISQSMNNMKRKKYFFSSKSFISWAAQLQISYFCHFCFLSHCQYLFPLQLSICFVFLDCLNCCSVSITLYSGTFHRLSGQVIAKQQIGTKSYLLNEEQPETTWNHLNPTETPETSPIIVLFILNFSQVVFVPILHLKLFFGKFGPKI